MHKFYRYVTGSILSAALILGLTGCENKTDMFVRLDTENSEIEEEPVTEDAEAAGADRMPEASTEEVFYVFVCGQIQNPGVYGLRPGSRICDAIDAAGGCLEGADVCAVNQAERVTDGSKIYIPAIGEALPASEGSTESDGLIHLNRATKEELMSLPGIGESKADLILAYREEHGGFSAIDEIMNIPGIKEGVFRRIEDYITVE